MSAGEAPEIGLATRHGCKKQFGYSENLYLLTCWPRSRQLRCSGGSSDRFRHCPSRVSRLSCYVATGEADFLGILPQTSFPCSRVRSRQLLREAGVKRVPNRHSQSGNRHRRRNPRIFAPSLVLCALASRFWSANQTIATEPRYFWISPSTIGLIPMQVAAFGQDNSRLPRSALFRKKVAGTNLG